MKLFQNKKLINDLMQENKTLALIISTQLSLIIKTQKIMSDQLNALIAQVQDAQTVEASAVALIQGLKQKLDDAIASGDTAQLQALSDELETSDASLAAAITANTPADNSGIQSSTSGSDAGTQSGTTDASQTGDGGNS